MLLGYKRSSRNWQWLFSCPDKFTGLNCLERSCHTIWQAMPILLWYQNVIFLIKFTSRYEALEHGQCCIITDTELISLCIYVCNFGLTLLSWSWSMHLSLDHVKDEVKQKWEICNKTVLAVFRSSQYKYISREFRTIYMRYQK